MSFFKKVFRAITNPIESAVKTFEQKVTAEIKRLPDNIQNIGKQLAREFRGVVKFLSPITGELVDFYSKAEMFVLSPVGKLFDKTLVKWDILPPNTMDAITSITAVPKRFATTGEFDRKELSQALRGATALALAPSYGAMKRQSSYIASGKENFGLVRTLDKYSGGILTAGEQVYDVGEKVAQQDTLKTYDWVTGGVGALKIASAVTTGGGSITASFVTTALTEKTNLADSSSGRVFIDALASATAIATGSATGVIQPPVNTEQLFAKTISGAVEAGASKATTKYLVRHTVLKEHKSGQILAISLGQSVGRLAGRITEETIHSIANMDWSIFDADDALPNQAMAKEIAIKTAENATAYEVAEELQKKGVNVSGQELSQLSENIRKSSSKETWQQRVGREIQKFVQEKLVNEIERLAVKELTKEAQEKVLYKIMAEMDRLILRLYDEAFDLISKYGIGMLIHLMRKYGLMADYKNVVRPEDYMEFQITINKVNQGNGRLFMYNNYVQPSPLPYVGAGLLALLGTTYLVV